MYDVVVYLLISARYCTFTLLVLQIFRVDFTPTTSAVCCMNVWGGNEIATIRISVFFIVTLQCYNSDGKR